MIALAGMNPMRFLKTEDPLEAEVMLEVAQRRHELAAEVREDLAVRTANAVGRMLGGGR